jgi:hypothetical protein
MKIDEHMTALGVPVLGGLPLGYGSTPMVVPIGAVARIDAAQALYHSPEAICPRNPPPLRHFDAFAGRRIPAAS